MDSGLYSAVGAMRGSLRSLDVLAHNLANISTHGFKRSQPLAQQFRVITPHGEARAIAARTTIDHSQGGFDATRDPMHLALEGQGFLAVESPNGEVYTRVARLALDADSNLTTVDGYPVAWESKLGAIDGSLGRLEIDRNGQVHQGSTLVGRLKFVDFADKDALSQEAGGYWSAEPGAQQITPELVVRQGFLERSNSEGITELIDLVENQRAYEIASRAITQIDQSYRRLNQGSS